MSGLTRLVCFGALLSSIALTASAQKDASDNDKTFVGKVSQGGLYEVMASQVAVEKATGAKVKKLAKVEVHDHERVNAELKKISAAKDVAIEPALNAEFLERLEKLKAASDFDAAYIDDMKAIHDKDEKLFAQEAVEGGATAYRAFAAKTDGIVKRHIAALGHS